MLPIITARFLRICLITRMVWLWLAQLRQNLDLFAAPPLTEPEIAFVRQRIPIMPDHLLDPAQWPLQ